MALKVVRGPRKGGTQKLTKTKSSHHGHTEMCASHFYISHFRMQAVQGWSELLKVLKHLRKFSKYLINKGSGHVIAEKETVYPHDGYVH